MRLSTRATDAIREVHRRDRASSKCDVGYIILTVCALADDYLSEAIRQSISQQEPFAHSLASYIYRAAFRFEGVPTSWRDRIVWVDRLGTKSIAGATEVQQFLLLTKVRNGLAHSAGGLTQRDRSDPKLFQMERELASVLDIGFLGKNFEFGSGTRQAVKRTGCNFISTVDSALYS